MSQVERVSLVPDLALGILHLLANFVTQDLIPVNFSACDRQLATQGLEGGVRHSLVVLTDSSLEGKQVLDYICIYLFQTSYLSVRVLFPVNKVCSQ